MESQIHNKLQGDEPVDIDYWQQLLQSLKIWKAQARLREMHEPVLKSRPKPPPKPKSPMKPQVNTVDPNENNDPIAGHDGLVEDNEAFTEQAQAMFDTETT